MITLQSCFTEMNQAAYHCWVAQVRREFPAAGGKFDDNDGWAWVWRQRSRSASNSWKVSALDQSHFYHRSPSGISLSLSLSLTHIWHEGGQRRRRRINLINVDQCWWLWFQHFGTKGQQRNLESLVIDCWIDWLICCPLNGSFLKKMHLVGIDQSTEGAGGVNWHLQTNNLPLRH